MNKRLTQVALAFGSVTFWMLGLWGGLAAAILAIACVGLVELFGTNRKRFFPAYGKVVLIAAAVFLPLLHLINQTSQFMTFWQMMGAVYVGSTFAYILLRFSEEIGNMLARIFGYIFGSGHKSTEGPPLRTRIPQPKYKEFVPPASWVYQCPRCGARVQHAIDVCWNCNYGEHGTGEEYWTHMGIRPPAPAEKPPETAAPAPKRGDGPPGPPYRLPLPPRPTS